MDISLLTLPKAQERGFARFEGGKLTISKGAANVFVKDSVIRVLTPVMQAFNMFSYMQLTSKNKFSINKIRATGLNLQKPTHCAWSPTKGVYIEQMGDLTPCEVESQFEMCAADFDDTCFRDLIEYNKQGKIAGANGQLTNEAKQLFMMITSVYADKLAIDVMSLFSSGAVYKGVDYKFKEHVSDVEKSNFKKQMGLCMGYARLIENVAMMPQSKDSFVKGLIKLEDCEKDKYIGDAEALIMSLRSKMGTDLNMVRLAGGIKTADGFSNLITIVSMQIYERLEAQYQEQCNDQVTKFDCIVKDEILLTTPVSNGGTSYTQKIPIFYVHGILVIPDPYLTYYDQYVDNSFFFAAVTVAGNINVGTNYGKIERDGDEMPIRIQIMSDVDEEGKIKGRTEAILSVTIANPNLMIATSLTTAW